MNPDTRFHAAEWHEPIVYSLSKKGRRGFIPTKTEDSVLEIVGDVISQLPEKMRRRNLPSLPEMSEPQVVRHFIRLSQENFGVDSGINVGVGTCTMKYNPRLNEIISRGSKIADLHPLQDESTVQGILEVMHVMEQWLCNISGMDECSLQPRAGASAIFTNALLIKAYHKSNGDLDNRREIITTVLSHPSDGAGPAMAGFKVITLHPSEETGTIDSEVLKAVVSKRTAGLIMTDPYDTGVFDPDIDQYIEIIHDAGGLVAVDQANANSILAKLRIGDAGADMCHFNLHKSFSVPHASGGPGSAPICVKKDFAKFLPIPRIRSDGSKFFLDSEFPESIGKVGGFFGVVPNVLRAYVWLLSMGSDGLKEVSDVAVINNNYLIKKLRSVKGVSLPWEKAQPIRLQEARFSLEQMKKETGIGIDDVNRRIVDFGIQRCFTSHEPWFIPEPFTPEPAESTTKEDLDRFAEVLNEISNEAYTTPELFEHAPYNCAIRRIDSSFSKDPKKWAMTWRVHLRKRSKPEN
jgi:glycine dehydrogenase subunit 2